MPVMIRARRWVAVLAVIGVVGAGCGEETDTPQARLREVQPRTLGFLGDLSGGSEHAESALSGAQVGVIPSTAPGSLVRLELVELDTEGDPTNIAGLLDGFLGAAEGGEAPLAVIVALEGEALSIAGEALTEAGIAFAVVSPELPIVRERGWEGALRVTGTTDDEGRGALAIITETPPAGGICAARGSDAAEGPAFVESVVGGLEGSAVTVALDEAIPGDIAGFAESIGEAGCEFVVFGGSGGEAGELRAALDDGGLGDVELLTNSGAITSSYFESAGDGAGPARAVCACGAPTLSETATAERFIDAYRTEFGAVPPAFAAEGRDAATLVLEGTRAAFLDQAGMAQWFGIASGSPGVANTLAFERGELIDAATPISLYSADAAAWVPEATDLEVAGAAEE